MAPVYAKAATDFVRRWHYSKSATGGVARYGWYTLQGGQLMGVSIFDLGNHEMRKGVFGEKYFSHVLHHQRLAVHPDVPHGMTSQFQAECLRQLKADKPDVWAVVTYADTDQGHNGTIYQATNAIYTGVRTKGNIYYLNPNDGSIVTMQSLKKRNGKTLTWPQRRELAAELGLVEMRSQGKHRYVYLLGTPAQKRQYPPLAWPVLDYPGKVDREATVPDC